MIAAIDYLVEFERAGHGPGIPERIEIDQEIFGGDASAADIAARWGTTERFVTRRRAWLRARGYRFEVPSPQGNPNPVCNLRARAA